MKANMKSLKRTLLAATLVLGQTFALAPVAVFAADSNVRIAGSVVMNDIATAGGMSGDIRASKIDRDDDIRNLKKIFGERAEELLKEGKETEAQRLKDAAREIASGEALS